MGMAAVAAADLRLVVQVAEAGAGHPIRRQAHPEAAANKRKRRRPHRPGVSTNNIAARDISI